MTYHSKSIRAFIGSKDYAVSRSFYQDLGFQENIVAEKMCYFQVNQQLGFYLQDYYAKDWIDNSMIFLEVDDVKKCQAELASKNLVKKYPGVRLSDIKYDTWGCELFLHDPSGILWHFGKFN